MTIVRDTFVLATAFLTAWFCHGPVCQSAPQLDIQPTSPVNVPVGTETPWYEGNYTNGRGISNPDLSGSDESIPFRIFAPRSYDFSAPSDDVRHPLIVYMHGAGGRGSNTFGHLFSDPLQYWASDLVQALSPTGGAFVLAPRITSGSDQWTDHPPSGNKKFFSSGYSADSIPVADNMELALELVAGLLDGGDNVDLDFQTRIDPSRIYIVGPSMGGFAVWDALGRAPEFPALLPEEYETYRFAAGVASSGAGPTDRGAAMADVLIWALRHDDDTVVPAAGTDNMIAAIEAAGGEPFFETSPLLSTEEFSTDRDMILGKQNLLTRFQGPLPLIAGVRSPHSWASRTWYNLGGQNDTLARWLFAQQAIPEPSSLLLVAIGLTVAQAFTRFRPWSCKVPINYLRRFENWEIGMKMNTQATAIRLLVLLLTWSVSSASAVGIDIAKDEPASSSQRPPNIVIIFLDDSGWGDFQPFAKIDYQTPNVESLARGGCQFNNSHVPQAVCSASRATLLSGCYPGRTGVFSAIRPKERGLDPKFKTLAEVLKPQDYVSACFGKWHIGDQPETRSFARGFDETCGLMYSHDMWEFHPKYSELWGKFPLQFWENDQVTIDRMTPKDPEHLTTWYTELAVDFIERHKEQPYFLYVPHSMPHVPLYCSEKFKGKSGAGIYSDVIMEIDWSVGEINKALKAAGVEDHTMILFTSDNGPWVRYGSHAGRTPFRGAKGASFDGGVRSACIIKYPGKIAAGTTSTQAFCTVDLLPTIARLAGAALPDYPIDGKDVWPLISGVRGSKNPHEYYPFSTGRYFEGVLSSYGRWKLHLPHGYRVVVTEPGREGLPGKTKEQKIGLSLFDMESDPSESTNVIDKYPEVASRLKSLALAHLKTFYPRQSFKPAL